MQKNQLLVVSSFSRKFWNSASKHRCWSEAQGLGGNGEATCELREDVAASGHQELVRVLTRVPYCHE